VIGKLLAIAFAGSLGTLARYGLAGVAQRFAGGGYPAGTLTVNLAGCFVAGFLWTLTEGRLSVDGELRAFIFIGFVGAFTTFSTYILETGEMIREGDFILAAVNMAVQNVGGIAALIAGIALARML